MKLKYLSVLLIIGVICLPAFRDYAYAVKDKPVLITRLSSKVFDFNSFALTTQDGLDKHDFYVINQNSGKVIYQNGRRRKGIKNDYGHRVFEVYCKGTQLFEIGHFITNSWVTNNYVLHLQKKNDEIVPELNISGKWASYADFYVKKVHP